MCFLRRKIHRNNLGFLGFIMISRAAWQEAVALSQSPDGQPAISIAHIERDVVGTCGLWNERRGRGRTTGFNFLTALSHFSPLCHPHSASSGFPGSSGLSLPDFWGLSWWQPQACSLTEVCLLAMEIQTPGTYCAGALKPSVVQGPAVKGFELCYHPWGSA